MASAVIAREALELARTMRATRRRTRSGRRPIPWTQVLEELERSGYGRLDLVDLQHQLAGLPLETHPAAPPSADELEAVDRSWREGWAADHPGEPFPGVAEAQRRAREAMFSRAAR